MKSQSTKICALSCLISLKFVRHITNYTYQISRQSDHLWDFTMRYLIWYWQEPQSLFRSGGVMLAVDDWWMADGVLMNLLLPAWAAHRRLVSLCLVYWLRWRSAPAEILCYVMPADEGTGSVGGCGGCVRVGVAMETWGWAVRVCCGARLRPRAWSSVCVERTLERSPGRKACRG